ncbi:YcxB family protein [Alicyclobacillus cycloheptanicus]|uniref:YcxB-like C-terminal domain-containing protein n=1 Tax=Alicyclobacillus cycloheptanicus TaxID=1457 RepID=A0ABT9XEW1_9BACL|nr:YcxB family protein [Alicyclobacillus cycloheptanicus]MDQ0188834.1 hypothetical protein [Alicyclobacillus cycloheptanicus]WDM00519.1 YcxB family protein [Alicyclobacillus cycloheptanicus]
MSVTYQLARKEYGRAHRQHLRRHPTAFLFQFFVLFFIVIQPTFIHGYGKYIDWVVMLIWFILLVRSARKSEKQTSEKTVTILDTGVQVASAFGSRTMYWNVINDVIFTPEFILIYVDRKVETIVPRRAFASKEMMTIQTEKWLFGLGIIITILSPLDFIWDILRSHDVSWHVLIYGIDTYIMAMVQHLFWGALLMGIAKVLRNQRKPQDDMNGW